MTALAARKQGSLATPRGGMAPDSQVSLYLVYTVSCGYILLSRKKWVDDS